MQSPTDCTDYRSEGGCGVYKRSCGPWITMQTIMPPVYGWTSFVDFCTRVHAGRGNALLTWKMSTHVISCGLEAARPYRRTGESGGYVWNCLILVAIWYCMQTTHSGNCRVHQTPLRRIWIQYSMYRRISPNIWIHRSLESDSASKSWV